MNLGLEALTCCILLYDTHHWHP